MKPSSRNLMAIVALVGTIHAAAADEALWAASVDTNYRLVRDGEPYQIRHEFVGDGKTYKMRSIFHNDKDGTVDDTIEEAPFRLLEEDEKPWVWSLFPPRALVGVKCLFRRNCMDMKGLTYDPIYNPKAPPKPSGYVPKSDSFGIVNPANADAVKRALHTLLRLNAAAPFEAPPR